MNLPRNTWSYEEIASITMQYLPFFLPGAFRHTAALRPWRFGVVITTARNYNTSSRNTIMSWQACSENTNLIFSCYDKPSPNILRIHKSSSWRRWITCLKKIHHLVEVDESSGWKTHQDAIFPSGFTILPSFKRESDGKLTSELFSSNPSRRDIV